MFDEMDKIIRQWDEALTAAGLYIRRDEIEQSVCAARELARLESIWNLPAYGEDQ